MLRVLRKNAQSPLIQAVVVIIAVVFIFWGVGSNLNSNASAVAVVDGTEITGIEFSRTYDRLLESYKQQFGGQVPEELLNTMGIRQQAINQLVQRELVRKGAGRLGLMISDQEVQRSIAAIPAFQNNGAFDLAAYQAVLAQNRLSETAFEEGIRNDLLADRALDAIAGFAQVSDQEIRQWLDYAGLEMQLNYAIFSREEFQEKVQVEEAQLASWYDENKEQYRPAALYSFAYLFFPFSGEMEDVQVSEEEMRAYFNEHAARWQTPEQRHVRHILFRLDQGASAEAKAAKKEAAEQALTMLRGGSAFNEVADSLTEDPAGKGKGGDLGFITRGQMVPQFEEAAFNLASGATSEVVESPFGFHLIKVESVKPESKVSFGEKKEEITEILAQQKTRALSFKKVSAAYEGVMRAGSLAKYSESAGQQLQKSDYLSEKAIPKDMALLQDGVIAKAAFALGKGELSSIIEGAKGYAILFADDVKIPEIPALEQIRSQVLADYSREKGIELMRQAADGALKALQENDKWPEAVAVKASAYIKRSDTGAEAPALMLQEAFNQLGKSKLPNAPINIGEDLVVYQITGVRQGEDTTEEAVRDSLKAQILQAQRNQLFSRWVARLQAQSKVWINPDILK
ncbi:MAG: SurA N-terminal domain-containing protein [bacterium]|nr:SurA N-terminal domain-containing protein [bacterium]